MAIEGIPSPSGSNPHIEKSEVKPQAKVVKAPPEAAPVKTGKAEPVQELVNKNPVEVDGLGKGKSNYQAHKTAHSTVELQAMTERLKEAVSEQETRHKISKISSNLVEAKQNLESATSEQVAKAFDAANSRTVWDNWGVVEKAQVVNRLKDEIRSMEVERSALVKGLKEQVNNGTYEVSGEEILQGMLDEYFE